MRDVKYSVGIIAEQELLNSTGVFLKEDFRMAKLLPGLIPKLT